LTDAVHFEDRHRELRADAPFEVEHEFNLRTGPLVDDLVTKLHRHAAKPSEFSWSLVQAALDALDAEAGRG